MQTGKHRLYELQDYNPDWKDWYKERSGRLSPLFGDNLISIEHIGSTAIVGMYAKPNIDILVVVKNLDQVTSRLQLFCEAGYTPQGREYVGGGDEYITEDTEDGKQITSIHTLAVGNAKIKSYIDFRDYLSHNEADRKLYINLKKQLYTAYKANYQAYDSGKAVTIEQINLRASKWANRQLKT